METPSAAPEKPPVVPAPEVVTPVAAPVEEAKPERVFTQKELDEVVEKRLAKERRKRDDLKRDLDAYRRIATERPAQQDKPQPADEREPVRADFAAYEDFIAAQSEYRAGKKTEAVLKKDREEREAKQREEDGRKSAETWRGKIKENSKGIEDFDDVLGEATSNPESAVSRLPADPIAQCDNPAKVLYHYATHPEEAERIASLPMGQQAREIWKLDATLAVAKPPEKPSKAPAPISPVGGSNTKAAGEMPDPNTNQKEWMAWRNEQIRAKRVPGKAA